jgi:hypothetical protein
MLFAEGGRPGTAGRSSEQGIELEEERWLLIRKEALNVATIMRMHTRFRESTRIQGEHELLRGFNDIRRRLHPPLQSEVMQLVRPFIFVIKSSDTTGPMTGSALVACDHFIRQRVVSTPQELEELIEGVLECRFEQSNMSGDEVVVSNMFQVFESACACEAASRVAGNLVVETLQTLVRVHTEMRFSEMLRHSTEAAIARMLEAIILPAEEGGRAKESEHGMGNGLVSDTNGMSWTLSMNARTPTGPHRPIAAAYPAISAHSDFSPPPPAAHAHGAVGLRTNCPNVLKTCRSATHLSASTSLPSVVTWHSPCPSGNGGKSRGETQGEPDGAASRGCGEEHWDGSGRGRGQDKRLEEATPARTSGSKRMVQALLYDLIDPSVTCKLADSMRAVLLAVAHKVLTSCQGSQLKTRAARKLIAVRMVILHPRPFTPNPSPQTLKPTFKGGIVRQGRARMRLVLYLCVLPKPDT